VSKTVQRGRDDRKIADAKSASLTPRLLAAPRACGAEASKHFLFRLSAFGPKESL
jgi:hypothetical protein